VAGARQTRAAPDRESAGARYSARLLVACADQPGIVAAVSSFLFARGANIVSSHQYSSDPSGGRFFLRTEFFLPDAAGAGDAAGPGDAGGAGDAGDGAPAAALASARRAFEHAFAHEVAARLRMDWRIRWWGERQRIAILVSRRDHCLVDLLWRWRRGELDADVIGVISNHRDLEDEASAAGVPYHHVPVRADAKPVAERRMLELLEGNAEVLVLARYMQILSGAFLENVGMPAINIHHSFLPAFAGAEPYRQAHEHGVKLIGATAHYATEQLDDGPIIEQDVARVDHEQSAQDLERVGRDIERMVLARAVSLHLEDRVIVDGRRTIVL
jgi:formyltetrahydrofolate deformylase